MSDHDATRPLRAAIYARVSTAEQVEGTSLATQRERCTAYVNAQGWTFAGEYIDAGESGAKESRPELDRLAAAVRRGELDVVLVAKLDRLGRTMRGLTALLADWDERGVRLVSVAESFDSASPSGRLMRNMLGAFAEFERERIAERTMDGIEAVVASGGWPGGPPPFGWRLERGDGRTELVLDDRRGGRPASCSRPRTARAPIDVASSPKAQRRGPPPPTSTTQRWPLDPSVAPTNATRLRPLDRHVDIPP